MAATAHLTVAAPDNEKFTVQSAPARLPRRKPNAEYRSREHLTEREVERLSEAMKGNRWGHRDATMVLIAFRHGLRASELVDLRWDQIDLEHALLHVRGTQKWQSCHAPIDRQGITRLEAATTRARAKVAVRVHIGTRHAIHQAWLSSDGRARWRGCWVRYEDSPSHAAPRLRVQVGQRRRRYQNDPVLSRPQVDPAYGALHRAGTNSVQKLIPGLTAPASFEATVGGSGCPRLVEFFKKISMNARGSLFALKYLSR